MALLIEKDTPQSASMKAVYWRAGDLMVTPGMSATVQMLGYWTKEDRDAGAHPVAAQGLTFAIGAPDPSMTRTVGDAGEDRAPPAVATAHINAMITALYEAVKLHPTFADAQDC